MAKQGYGWTNAVVKEGFHRTGIPVHEGMEKYMPKVKYDRKKVLAFLDQILERAATNDEDRLNVALDLFIVALNAQETEFKVQAIVDYLGKEFKVSAPKVVAELEEIPF